MVIRLVFLLGKRLNSEFILQVRLAIMSAFRTIKTNNPYKTSLLKLPLFSLVIASKFNQTLLRVA